MKLFCSALSVLFSITQVFGQAPAIPRTTASEAGVPLPASAKLPSWPKPAVQPLTNNTARIRSEDIELIHSVNAFGRFEVRVAGKSTAVGGDRPIIGYLSGDELKWLDPSSAADTRSTTSVHKDYIGSTLVFADAEGGHWTIKQEFRPGRLEGTIDVETTASVDQKRQVAFMPMLLVYPGVGSFGTQKGQGLLAGLEYLENEPSSSEADLIGAASRRQVPDSLKLTFPLMAIQQSDRYLGLTWQMRMHLAAVFDSPDRLFASGGHVMGAIFPGSNGTDREEGNLLPKFAQTVEAGATVSCKATLLGGPGKSVVEAVQHYAKLRPLPPVPDGSADLTNYVAQASAGWLDSKLREGPLVRHAILGGNFPPGQAADAGMWMDWLAARTSDAALSGRLRLTASNVLAAVPASSLLYSGVGHVHYPSASLIYGQHDEALKQARQRAQSLAAGFEPDGSLKYRPRKDGPDYAKTHYSNEANGFTSRAVLDLLEAAAFCGDQTLIEVAIQKLRAMDKFNNAVPRGAQTWECPLHTPDILASAQMVRAYTLGYELTADPRFLESAKYWAWTGVPFVYLVHPTEGKVGLYATIAVFGATQWQAPVWLGLPVQWCGLVYADSLYRLVRHDPKGPWKHLADGITASGIQQSWPPGDGEAQGLLPDSFVLRTQHRNGPAINPATLQACAQRLVGQTAVYDFWCFAKGRIRVHAPGQIANVAEKGNKISFEVEPALPRGGSVLINGLSGNPRVKLNGKDFECSAENQERLKAGVLVLPLSGRTKFELAVDTEK